MYDLFDIVLLLVILWLALQLRSFRRQVDERLNRLEIKLDLPSDENDEESLLASPTTPAERDASEIATSSTPGPTEPEAPWEEDFQPAEERPTEMAEGDAILPQPAASYTRPLDQMEDSRRKRTFISAPLDWFLRIHLLVQVGAIILFIGIAFLLKYVTDQGWFSLELRHIAAATGGLLLVGAGWGLRLRARNYGLALQGAGLGAIYLTTFFAYRIYGLIPVSLAFAVFVALGVICITLAVLNDARILAFLATIGAFLAPILAGDGGGGQVALFSYYAAVNAVILTIAWFKSWRSLNLAGFFFTLAAGLFWGRQFYTPELFSTTELFLILFFLTYVAIAILFTVRQSGGAKPKFDSAIDITLIYGNPLTAFSLQLILVRSYLHGAGWSALAMGAFYLVLAIGLWRWLKGRHPLLSESILFLAFFFLTLSIPEFFDPRVTSATWAISGAASTWMGSRRQRVWQQWWGALIQISAGVLLLIDITINNTQPSLPFLNVTYVGGVILSFSGLFSAYQIRKKREREHKISRFAFPHRFRIGLTIWGILWWFFSGLAEIGYLDPPINWVTGGIVFLALSCMAFELLGRRLRWKALRIPALVLWFVLLLLASANITIIPQPFVAGGWFAWPLAIVIHYWALYNYRDAVLTSEQTMEARWIPRLHAAGLWLITLLLTWFASWLASQLAAGDGWFWASLLAVPALIILGLSGPIDRLPWPIATNRRAYLLLGLGPLAFWGVIWLLGVTLNSSGDSAPWPYIPVLNPLDLVQILFFGSVLVWIRRLQSRHAARIYWVWGGLLFAAANLSIARAVHQMTGVAFTLDTLYYSAQLQSIYAVFWGGLALALVFTASRLGKQDLWIAGVILLGITVIKLFIVDLANSDSLARIVSFIGVGLLTILVAYFAPARGER